MTSIRAQWKLREVPISFRPRLTPMSRAVFESYGRQMPWFAAAWRMKREQLGKDTNWRLVLPDVWGRFA